MDMNTRTLRYICTMPTDDLMTSLAAKYNAKEEQGYLYVNNHAPILAIAHLDTVADDKRWAWRKIAYVEKDWPTPPTKKEVATTVNGVVTEVYKGVYVEEPIDFEQKGDRVISIGLDDRLGVWIITELLPQLGIKCDYLFTTGEEKGQSSAMFFTPPEGKTWNWMFQFDRHGLKPVAYEYENDDLVAKLKSVGVSLDIGSFSDICWMNHLGITGINWAAGYNNEHSYLCYAKLKHVNRVVREFARFYKEFHNIPMLFDAKSSYRRTRTYTYLNDDYFDNWGMGSDWKWNGTTGHWERKDKADQMMHEYDTKRITSNPRGSWNLDDEEEEIALNSTSVNVYYSRYCKQCKAHFTTLFDNRTLCVDCQKLASSANMRYEDVDAIYCYKCGEALLKTEKPNATCYTCQERGMQYDKQKIAIEKVKSETAIKKFKAEREPRNVCDICGEELLTTDERVLGICKPCFQAGTHECWNCGNILFPREYASGLCDNCVDIANLNVGG